ncbi:MAG: hypothetical protein QM487_15475 [Candidatus Marithrix sp.]
MINAPQLTNLQMEILEIYSIELLEKELNELKIHIANFSANKAIQEAELSRVNAIKLRIYTLYNKQHMTNIFNRIINNFSHLSSY